MCIRDSYEMHVRGFTKDASSGVKGGGTFEGLRQKIPYLKDQMCIRDRVKSDSVWNKDMLK